MQCKSFSQLYTGATLKFLFACYLSATQYGGSIFTCENVCLLLASKRFRFLVRNFALIWDVILTKTNWMRHLSVARLRLFSFRRCQEHKNTSKNHLSYSKYWVPMYYGGGEIQIKSSFDTISPCFSKSSQGSKVIWSFDDFKFTLSITITFSGVKIV